MDADKRYYVYVYYFTDTNEVFYVGRGCGRRCKQLGGRTPAFLAAVESGRPIQRIVCQDLTLTECKALEVKTIEQCKQGRHPLVNYQHVGTAYFPVQRKPVKQRKKKINAYDAGIADVAKRYQRSLYGGA